MPFRIDKNLIYQLSGIVSPAVQAPIFIIGTGRCGTSLFVRILNSHVTLIGFPGEANDLWHPKSYPFSKRSIQTPAIIEDPGGFTGASLAAWPVGQGRRIQNVFAGFKALRGPKKKFFTKSAMISFVMPKILALFPDAKFIHIYRNGPSVVASLSKKEWGKYVGYFADESEFMLSCAKYWNACILEIEARKKTLSIDAKGAYCEFSYEQLCEDPRSILRKIAKFLDVDSDGYTFDFSNIASRNYKVGYYKNDKQWFPLLEAIEPAMRLKSYRI